MGRKLVLLAVVLVSSLALTAGTAGAHDAQYTYCNMWTDGQQCVTPWNNTSVVRITNGAPFGQTSTVYCFSHHTDGSWTGGAGDVGAHQTGYLYPSGYNQTICYLDHGPGGFPISITTW